MACAEKCGMCDQRGLPILLTRYALAPEGSGAPRATDAFRGSEIDLAGKAYFTRRLPREGYIYLYNPANEHSPWIAYLVDGNGGYLYPFPIPPKGPGDEELTIPKSKNDKAVPCIAEKNPHLARSITIPNPTKTDNIWIMFTDVQWTQKVWERYNANEDKCRDKTMTQFNVKEWDANTKKKHAHAIPIRNYGVGIADFAIATKLNAFRFCDADLLRYSNDRVDWEKMVVEMGMNKNEARSMNQEELRHLAMGYAPTRWGPGWLSHWNEAIQKAYKGPSDKLVRDFDELRKDKGVVLTLEDPTGIVMDLTSLMDGRLNDFVSEHQRENERELWNSSVLIGLRQMIEAQSDEMQYNTYVNKVIMEGIGGYDHTSVLVEDYDAEHYAECRETAWNEYFMREDRCSVRYNEPQRQAVQNKFNKALKDFNDESIAKLAYAHVKWLEFQPFRDLLNYSYDEDNLDSGKVFTQVFTQCAGNTADKAPQLELYIKWLTTAPLDDDNLLFRALGLDHRPNLEILKKAIADGAAGLFSLSTFVGILKQSSKSLGDAGKTGVTDKVFANLLHLLRTPLMHCFQRMTEKHIRAGTIPRWTVLLGWCHGGDLVVPVVRSNTPGATLQTLQDEIKNILGMKTLPKGLADTIERSYRDKVKYIGSKGVIVIDKQVVFDEMNRLAKTKGATLADVSKASVSNAVRLEFSADAVDDLRQIRNNKHLMDGFKNGFPKTVNTLNGLYSLYSVWGLWEGLCNARTNERDVIEPLMKFGSGLVAVWTNVGTRAETYLVSQVFLKYRKGAGFANWLSKYGGIKALGYVGPGVALVWDTVHGLEAFKNSETGLTYAYVASVAIDLALLSIVTISVVAAKVVAAQAAGVAVSRGAAWAVRVAAGATFAGVGFILFVAALALGAYIEHLKNEKKKKELKEWFEKSYFGTATAGKYRTLHEEQQVLANILEISMQAVKGN